MDYNFREIEQKWQTYWANHHIFKTNNHSSKPKFYVLDMFPYPSGAGLHVGHPLGYIAGDIFARYKRLQGFNVLHPMGFDAYGLPAEQYAIETGQHPAITTEKNAKRYREQLDKLGLSFDWDREIKTCDPHYYKWTQWTFIQLFHSYYNEQQQKARPIAELINHFETHGSQNSHAFGEKTLSFTAQEWINYSEVQKNDCLMNYRLAFLAYSMVNWCPKLGTVLANDEIVNGLSVRGGYPVERRSMKQWSLRITAYAERLLKGLDQVEWNESIKEIQRHWIGRSEGAAIHFSLADSHETLEIFTTRPDTIFGVSFMVLCPEHPIIEKITTTSQRKAVETYVAWAKNRSERERQAEVKQITGIFTGAFAIHPFTQEKIPIWVSDYVLAGYGTGAVMAVPAHDNRDFVFAKHFQLPIKQVILPEKETPSNPSEWQEAKETKSGQCIQSDFLNNMSVAQAGSVVINKIEEKNIGYRTINYRLRDAIFSRQRYWGEPFPIYYKNNLPHTLDENDLPLLLPDIDVYLPTETGEPPIARAKDWKTKEGYPLDCNTMPGFAGSNGYYLRYMDPHNNEEYFSAEANNYWKQVDLYVGGTEHATGHLLYARFWNKFLYDLGLTVCDEPFKKMINQGMIQGRTSFVYRCKDKPNVFVSAGLKEQYDCIPIRVDIHLVNNDLLDTERFKQWRAEYSEARFVLEDGKYICGYEIEKMSKSFYNVENPDDLVETYGADTLRLYEMFLGPIEQAKPWDTKGIEGVSRFIRRFWKRFHDENNQFHINHDTPTDKEWKILHKTIKKIQEDVERFSMNTAISTFMICLNELSDLQCNKRDILEPLVVLISPFAPHIAEELWSLLGHTESISFATFPEYDESKTQESTFAYPVSFNGKTRFTIELPLTHTAKEVENAVLNSETAQKYLEGKTPQKVIFVPKRIINIVL